MSEVKHNIELEWKAHNVNVAGMVAFVKGEDANCCGASAGDKLQLHFLEEPSQEVKDAIAQKWEDMDDEEHELCADYKSAEDLAAEKAVLKQSAKNKLKALGLTDDEIAAM